MKFKLKEHHFFIAALAGIFFIGTFLMALRLFYSAKEDYQLFKKENKPHAAFAALRETAGKFHNYDQCLKNFFIPHVNAIRTMVFHMYTGALMGTGHIVFPADYPHNVVVLGPNRFLYYMNSFSETPEKEQELFRAVADFSRERSIPEIQLLIPNKQLTYKARLRNHLLLKTETDFQVFRNAIQDCGVPVLDSAPLLQSLQCPGDEIFFRTDHHWTPFAALHVLNAAVEMANGQHGMNFTQLSLDTDFEKAGTGRRDMLGFQGIRVGRHWLKLDRKNIYLPKTEDLFTVTMDIPDQPPVVRKGSFSHAILGDAPKRGTFFDGKDYPRIVIENHNIPTGHILVIQDSFGRTFSGYLSLIANKVTVLDPRYQTIEEFMKTVRSENYDLILYLRSMHTLGLINSRNKI